jgi:hypothetical protein
MIAKPAISWLNTDGELLLINDITVVLNATADNVNIYANPDPPLAEIKLDLDNYTVAVHLQNPSQADTINKNNLRLVLTTKVRSLSYYVAKACNGSLANLIKSGFPPQKGKGQPVGTPAQPQGLTVSHGPQLSQLVAGFNPVFGAVLYNYRLLANTPGAVPVIVQDTAATHTFTGLIAGVKYTIDVSASGTGGTLSDWSSPVSLTAD